MSEIVLVVAIADNDVIGKDGAIPWHISGRYEALQGAHHGPHHGDGAQDLGQSAEEAAAGPASMWW